MSTFSTQSFLDQEISEPNVKRPPIPAGDYTGVIGEPTEVQGVDPKDPTRIWRRIDIKLAIDVPFEVQQSLGLDMPTLTLRDSFFLDMTPSGGLDTSTGKNSGLRRYREATDLNKPGDRFSLRMLQGRTVRVRVGHRQFEDSLVEEVKGVAKL